MLVLAIGCARAPAPRLDDIARGYVEAALQLAQHQPSLVEAWRGDPAWRPGPREPVARIRARLLDLLAAVPERGDATEPSVDDVRAGYLRGQLQALDLAAGRLLGEPHAFADEVQIAFGVALRPADPAAVAAARAALDRLLPGDGPLGERHAAYRRTIAIPAERERAVLQVALDACRARTRSRVTLPDDESVTLTLGVDSPWDGFARYQGQHRSVIEISGGSPLDVSRALHLACHEAYPGHHTHSVLLDSVANPPVELLLQPAFGPHLLATEGAAEAGVDLVFPATARALFYREVLLPQAGLPADRADLLVAVETAVATLETTIPAIVAAYLDSRATRAASLSALAQDAAVMNPESLLAFAERQRTRAIVYVLGRQAVGDSRVRQVLQVLRVLEVLRVR